MGISISAIRATLVNIIISYRERGDRLLERCLYLRGIDTTRVRVRARVRVRVREREREREWITYHLYRGYQLNA